VFDEFANGDSQKQLETMARLDPTYADLKAQSLAKGLTSEQSNAIKSKMTEREQLLGPIYQQIALQFADLHDRAGRMEAKGTIRMPVVWKNARRFFYWRLRRKLSEEVLLKKLGTSVAAGVANTPMAQKEYNLAMLRSWTGLLDAEFDKDDQQVASFYETHRKDIYQKIEAKKGEGVTKEIVDLLLANKEASLKGVQQVLSLVPVGEREKLVKYLLGN
jgi:acetyl-CoA carboxylase / biotin carboxylase 1